MRNAPQTPKKLEDYYHFDPEVVGWVTDAADRQQNHTFGELAAQLGIEDGPQHSHDPHRIGYDYLDLKPKARNSDKHEYDPKVAQVLIAPMGESVGRSLMMRGMRLFAAQPDDDRKRLLIVGMPGIHNLRAYRLKPPEIATIAFTGSLEPLVRGPLIDLHKQGVEEIDLFGYSAGADVSATAASVAHNFNLKVHSGVFVESASAHRRLTAQLAFAFMNSAGQIGQYVMQANSDALTEVHKVTAAGTILYTLGLGRVVNLAVARAISRGRFRHRVTSALMEQPEMFASIGWGSVSELSRPTMYRQIVQDLQSEFGEGRIGSMEFTDMHHSGADNINLHAAMMRQGLRLRSANHIGKNSLALTHTKPAN